MLPVRSLLAAAMVLVTGLTGVPAAIFAADVAPAAPATAVVTIGDLRLAAPWARATAPAAMNGAAFLTLDNGGATDRLVAATADVSRVVELHTHVREGEVMRMRKVDAIEVTGGTTTRLEPGGLHIMLIGLHKPLAEGQRFPLTLTFANAGNVVVDVTVKAIGATDPGSQGGHGGHM